MGAQRRGSRNTGRESFYLTIFVLGCGVYVTPILIRFVLLASPV